MRTLATRCLLCLLLTTSMGVWGAASAQQRLRVAVASPLVEIDPHFASAPATRDFANMVYDTLFALDAQGDVRAQMVAEHQVSADGLIWRFELRDGLSFHDGTPVTSDDVVASLLRWSVHHPLGQALFDSVAAIRALESTGFEIRLSRPSGLLPWALAGSGAQAAFIMPAAIAAQIEPLGPTQMNGSGPFVFDAAHWRPGGEARFTRHADYLPRTDEPSGLAGAKRAGVDEVVWRHYPDPVAAMRALRDGQIDLISRVRHDLIPALTALPGIRIAWTDTLGEQLIFRFNVLHPPFDDARVRRAVAIVFSQIEFLEAAVGTGPQARSCHSVYVCRAADAVSAGLGDWLSGDLARARALVLEAGHEGSTVRLLGASDLAVMRNLPEVAADMLASIGLEPEIEMLDWQQMRARRDSQAPPGQGGWNGVFASVDAIEVGDPVSNPWLNTACSQAVFGWPCDDLVQSLRYRYAHTPDATERRLLAGRIEERIRLHPSHVPLGQWLTPNAIGPGVSGELSAPVPIYWGYTKRALARPAR